MRNDETIALNALMFAERWKLQPWLDIRWDEETESYSTFIMSSSSNNSFGDAAEDESEHEIFTLEDLNVLLATEAEFYDKVTTLISIGALEAYDIEIESLIKVIVDRISGVSPTVPYLYSMKQKGFSVDEDRVYEFDELEEETGLLVLDAIRVLSRTGDWWGETLDVRHANKEWSKEKQAYVPSADRCFTISVNVKNAYRDNFQKVAPLTEENFHLFISSVDDVMSIGEDAVAAAISGMTGNYLASILFCERTEEDSDVLAPARVRQLPLNFLRLLPASRRLRMKALDGFHSR